MAKLAVTPLERHRKGDAWVGLTVPSVLFDGIAPAAEAASVKMQLRDKYGTLGYEFTSANTAKDTPTAGKGFITFTAATWAIIIPPQILDVAAGKWYWDLEVTDVNGLPTTIAAGTITIDSDITHA